MLMNPAPSTLRVFLATLISACCSLQAQEGALLARCDRETAIYKVRESVNFNLQTNGTEQPGVQVEWSILKNGLTTMDSGSLQLSGKTSFEGKLNEPGFLLFRASRGGAKKAALAGAGVDPLEIKPSMPPPPDFDQFWDEQLKHLAAVPKEFKLTPLAEGGAGVEVFDLQAKCAGAPVSGYFVKPTGAKPGSLPAILTTHGAGVGGSKLATAVGWGGMGMLALDINAHGLPNGREGGFYKAQLEGPLKNYRHKGWEQRESVYFLGMFLRVVRAIDFLAAQPEWDGRTLVVYGTSQGGAQAIIAAALDPRVSFFVAGVPAMCDHTGALAGRAPGWPQIIPKEGSGQSQERIRETSRYFDMVNFTPKIKVPGFFTVGFIDPVCPPAGVYAAYNQLQSKKAIFNDIATGHANSPEARKQMQDAINQHLASQRNP